MVKELDLKSAPRVPETVLKRRRASKFASSLNGKGSKRSKKNNEKSVKRAERFVLEYRNKERSGKRAERALYGTSADGKRKENIPENTNVLLVVRIRAGKKEEIPQAYKHLLRQFKLRKLFHATFLKTGPEVLKKLKVIEEYVTWGYPNAATVKDLIYKRGYTMKGDKRIPLSDNNVVEEQLGEYGIICTEDVIHELIHGSENFESISKFLCPFELGAPKQGFTKERKLKKFAVGGEQGNRGSRINELVRGMN